MDKFVYSDKAMYLMGCITLAGVMAAVWGGISWVIGSEHSLVVALVVFLVMFGLLARGEGDGDD